MIEGPGNKNSQPPVTGSEGAVAGSWECGSPDYWLLRNGTRRSGRPADLTRHVEEEIRRSALRHRAFALLGRLAGLFAVLAADRERQRTKTRLRDLVAALEAVAVGAVFQASQSCVDLRQCLGLHLDERELDVLLDVDFGALALIQDIALLVAFEPDVANPTLNFGEQFPAAVFEHLLQLVVAVLRTLGFRRRRHDPCRSLRVAYEAAIRPSRFRCA